MVQARVQVPSARQQQTVELRRQRIAWTDRHRIELNLLERAEIRRSLLLVSIDDSHPLRHRSLSSVSTPPRTSRIESGNSGDTTISPARNSRTLPPRRWLPCSRGWRRWPSHAQRWPL